MIHWLKTDHAYFQESWAGSKPFEIRQNDRDFQVDDIVILADGIEPAKATRAIITRVTNVHDQYTLGGWVVLGLHKLGHIDDSELALFEYRTTTVHGYQWTSSTNRPDPNKT